MADKGSPADWVDVHILAIHPLIVVFLPAVEMNLEESADNPRDGADADQPGIHLVRRLHLHPNLEAVLDVVLGDEEPLRGRLGVGALEIVVPREVGLPLSRRGLQLDVLLFGESRREDQRRTSVVAEAVGAAFVRLVAVNPVKVIKTESVKKKK